MILTPDFMNRYIDLKIFNRILYCASTVLLISLITQGLLSGQNLYRDTTIEKKDTAPLEMPTLEHSSSVYIDSVIHSPLFGYVPETLLAHELMPDRINDLVKDYRLRGVIILDAPEAIIEDARTQKTFFIKVGEQIGELVVSEIKNDTMTVTYGQERKEFHIE